MSADVALKCEHSMKDLTQDELKKLISYDPETGLFTRVIEGTPDVLRPRKTLSIAGSSFQAKDLAWLYVTGSLPVGTVLQLNRDRLDFRFANLAVANASQVRAARRPWGKHGKGVYFDAAAKSRPWRAFIYNSDSASNESLGRFASREEAAGVFEAKYRDRYGQFARLA
jgi:hypothetical protein